MWIVMNLCLKCSTSVCHMPRLCAVGDSESDHMVHSTWCTVQGVQYKVYSTRRTVQGVQYKYQTVCQEESRSGQAMFWE